MYGEHNFVEKLLASHVKLLILALKLFFQLTLINKYKYG